jgi:hypothetical protein
VEFTPTVGVAFITLLITMNSNKNEAGNLLPMTVTEGVTVSVLPNEQHEYLMTTREVANGYGVTQYAILMSKARLTDELIEGKHFVTAITIGYSNTIKGAKVPHNAILWTKRGIVRLGFTMRNERAKLFRDWAEELVVRVGDAAGNLNGAKSLPKKRNHNRLTSERLIRLLQLTHQIDNSALRGEIVNQLMGGRDYGNV